MAVNEVLLKRLLLAYHSDTTIDDPLHYDITDMFKVNSKSILTSSDDS